MAAKKSIHDKDAMNAVRRDVYAAAFESIDRVLVAHDAPHAIAKTLAQKCADAALAEFDRRVSG